MQTNRNKIRNPSVNISRIISIALLMASVGYASICSAFEVWIGTSCTPHNAAVKPETWANAAKHVNGLNINLAPCKPDKDTPSENEIKCTRKDWRIILAQYGQACKKGMVPIARSAIQGETNPDKPLVPDFLARKFKKAEEIGYGIGSIMLYDNRLGDVMYKWKVEEIQAIRDWLNANGHAEVTLAYDVRNFSEGAKAWCQNPLIQDILLEGGPDHFYSNKGNRQELVKWLWTDKKTANKRLIFQIPVSGCENPFGNPSGYQQVRRFVRWLGTDLMNAEFLQSSRVVILPVTYNSPTFTFYPEMTKPETYANTLTGIVLSLCEQKDLFEQRTRIPTVEDADSYVRLIPKRTPLSEGSFQIAQKGEVAVLYVDSNDWPGVIRAAGDLAADINRVTGVTPKITNNEKDLVKNTIIIGTIGKSPLIDQLIKDGKIDAGTITGQWESTITTVVPKPVAGVDNALVIAGSDKRGTIYGIYDLSEQIGVSPWYWWADVPVEHKDSLFFKAGTYVQGPPAVKYRGIFINDEGFALTPWVKEKFGNYNSQFYTKVFELLLRLKANYLWPAMWNNAFNEDDPNNPRLADEYGIVMGTSHQEPMLRAQKEWDRRYHKPWDYWADTNKMQDFWREGVRRNKNYESIISMGLRGANDSAMSKDKTVEQCAEMLEKIIDVQRKIIAEEVNPDVTKVPQLWCPYKEAQEYYEKGAKIPEDITILWCDDNWGNIRRPPTEQERKRSGGAGIYYHFDFHGGPRSYEWLNTSPIPRIWEQFNLAYNYGATRIWIVNVGDIKPMEFPIEFLMTFAWDPQKWPAEKLPEYTRLWAQRQFGPKYATDIADIITKYTKYNGRRKPELIAQDTYSLINYREADTVSADFDAISAKAEKIYNEIPAQYKDAFYQLVLYPTKACANLTDLYIAAAKNKLYAQQKRANTNDMAELVKALFKADAEMSQYYNKTMAGGKWDHIMDSAHIGWTKWDTPGKNIMPKVVEINVPAEANMGIAVEGSTSAWPASPDASRGGPGPSDEAALPQFDLFGEQKRYIDVFNRGSTPFEFTAKPGADWIVLSADKGKIDKEQRLWINIDWSKAPQDKADGSVKIAGAGAEVTVKISSFNPAEPNKNTLKGFAEADGYVSIEAEHYTNKVDKPPVKWQVVPDLSRTLSGIIVTPVTAKSQSPVGDSPRLEYKMYLFSTGKVEVKTYMSPTENFTTTPGLRYAISFDDETPQIVNININDTVPDWKYPQWWNEQVTNNIKTMTTTHTIDKSGEHVLKFWLVDPGIVLQKIVVNTGGVKPCYLGPPESERGGNP